MTHSLSALEEKYWESRINAHTDEGGDADVADFLLETLQDIQLCSIMSVYPIRRDEAWEVFLELEPADGGRIWLKEPVTLDTLETAEKSILFRQWDALYATVDDIIDLPVLVTGLNRVRDADRHEYTDVVIGTEQYARESVARRKTPSEVRHTEDAPHYAAQCDDFVEQMGLWALYAMRDGAVPLIINAVDPATSTSALVTAESPYAPHVQLQWVLSFDETAESNAATDHLLDSLGAGEFTKLRGEQVFAAPTYCHPTPLFTGTHHNEWGVYMSSPPMRGESRLARVLRYFGQSSVTPL